jgi:NADPH:quinone reductase-like Zn-dependent oxidoreductase
VSREHGVRGVRPAACAGGAGRALALPTLQQQWQLVRSGSAGYELRRVEAPVRRPGAHEVLVRVRAAALNRRDLFVMKGQYPVATDGTIVPLSDGAGDVVAVGPDVRRVRVGDRVVAAFFQAWVAGPMTRAVLASALGGGADGMLSQYDAQRGGSREDSRWPLLRGGATLPCAGVTA